LKPVFTEWVEGDQTLFRTLIFSAPPPRLSRKSSLQ